MDEVSSYVRLDLPSPDGKAAPKIVPPRLRIPYWKGLGADSEEKREPASDIDTVVVDSLKALDPERPIREADMRGSEFLQRKPRLTVKFYYYHRLHYDDRVRARVRMPDLGNWR